MIDNFSFAVFPLELITNSRYSTLSNGAKILYMLMLNRKKASACNPKKFRDDKGIFIYYSISDISKHLKCSERTAVKAVSALVKAGLIVREQAAPGLSCRFYVKDICQDRAKHKNKSRTDKEYSFNADKAEENARVNRKRFGDEKYIKDRKAVSRGML